MASGASVDADCVDKFQEFKLKHNGRYIIYKLTPDYSVIQVSKYAPKSASYDEFIEDLRQIQSKKECCYAVYDLEVQVASGATTNKLLFIMWAPEDAQLKQKMVYASSKELLKKKLVGIQKEMQANEMSDLALDHMLESAK